MIQNIVAVEGINQILANFEDHDLFGLATTVTQGLLKNKLDSRQEASDAIIKYSSDAASFLRRKVVTRDILFQYLHSIRVDVKLPITKDKLINRILKYWKEEENTEDQHEILAIENNIKPETIQPNINPEEQIPTSIDTTRLNQQDVVEANAEIDLMAQKFSEWFYTLMNKTELISTEHFYEDANLSIKLINGDMVVQEEVKEDVDELVKLLFKTKMEHNLFFNPNLTKEGTKGKMNVHGLVMIMSCGTLHINNIISGVFEQVFALARDPFSDNNWKIKNTELILRSKNNVSKPPVLCGDEFPQTLEIKN